MMHMVRNPLPLQLVLQLLLMMQLELLLQFPQLRVVFSC
jgi:hypothetical protein